MKKQLIAGLVLLGSTALIAGPVLAADGAAIYKANCVTCHGASGKGDGPAGKYLQPVPMDFTKSVKDRTDTQLTKAVADGGPAVGKSPLMAGFGKRLSAADIKAVVTYIKAFAKK